jgi:hypothetical protein
MLKQGVSLQESEQFLTAMAGWSQIVEPRTPTRRHVGHRNAPSPGNATCPSVRTPLNEFPYKSCQSSHRHPVKRLHD